MIICKALTVVDNCGILDENTTFLSLVERIESLIDTECKELTKAIEKRNFALVSIQFARQEQQLKESEKYDYAKEYLVNEMFTITKELTNIIEILPTVLISNIRLILQIFGQLTKQTPDIITLKLQ